MSKYIISTFFIKKFACKFTIFILFSITFLFRIFLPNSASSMLNNISSNLMPSNFLFKGVNNFAANKIEVNETPKYPASTSSASLSPVSPNKLTTDGKALNFSSAISSHSNSELNAIQTSPSQKSNQFLMSALCSELKNNSKNEREIDSSALTNIETLKTLIASSNGTPEQIAFQQLLLAAATGTEENKDASQSPSNVTPAMSLFQQAAANNILPSLTQFLPPNAFFGNSSSFPLFMPNSLLPNTTESTLANQTSPINSTQNFSLSSTTTASSLKNVSENLSPISLKNNQFEGKENERDNKEPCISKIVSTSSTSHDIDCQSFKNSELKQSESLKSESFLISKKNDTIRPILPNSLDAIEKMLAETEPDPSPKPMLPLSKHQCQFCRKHFSSSSALQIHIRTHTGKFFIFFYLNYLILTI